MHHPVLEFVHAGELVSLPDVPPTRTLLQVLREDLGLTATKEGCNEGDCGACTVVLGEKQGDQIKYSAVNSCIRLAHSIHGMALWTAQDLTAADGTPHPVQQALLKNNASQCGFCTPGFAMSLFGLYQNQVCQGESVSRDQAQQALSGNLCRCTGYRPILDAAQQLAKPPVVRQDEASILSKLELLAQSTKGLEANLSYKSPTTLADLLQLRAAYPKAQIVAGCTDVGLWINKLHREFETVLDITQVAELRQISSDPNTLTIGAAVTLTDAFDALLADRSQLHSFVHRFAGLPVRNSGTLGGNVANGSPIGDSMPLLIALGAHVVLMHLRKGDVKHREMPLEDLYTGYRKNVMAPDEVLAWIKVPKAKVPKADVPKAAPPGSNPGGATELCRAYKVSKRFEDDISAVCLVIRLQLAGGRVQQVSIGAGGVAATPVRARRTEAVLQGQQWNVATIANAIETLRSEFAPISDMRASAAYRSEVLGNLLQRFWLESQGTALVDLQQLVCEGENA